MRAWLNDLAIGVRLAVGGGRTSLARFLLSTLGVATAVAVLLLAASVQPTIEAHEDRAAGAFPNSRVLDGVTPLAWRETSGEFRGENVVIRYVHAPDGTSPVPPGVDSLPGEGAMWVSAELADRLAEPGSGLLRERFPQRTEGVIGQDGVTDPHHLLAYVGVGPELLGSELATTVYSFGGPDGSPVLDPSLLLLVLLGIVALLVPVFIFVAASTRIAGAERDRRLSALRLVGGGDRQVRRIAAAESLVSAVAGLLVGGGLYQLGRVVAPSVTISGISVYPSDIVPVWWLAALVVLAIPVLAVLTAQFALRRTIIEPLSVVRSARPVDRRLGWRFAVIGLGVVLLLWHGGSRAGSTVWSYTVALGATLLLFGVPILLPPAIERSVSRLRGGPTSWQLAIRRLQLDSGTSARVVGGVAIVLAGAIALQSVLTAQASRFAVPSQEELAADPGNSSMLLYPTPGAEDLVLRVLDGVPGVRTAFSSRHVSVVEYDPGRLDTVSSSYMVISCADAAAVYGVRDCADGQIYTVGDRVLPEGLTAGATIRLGDEGSDRPTWTVPTPRPVAAPEQQDPRQQGIFITAGGTLPSPLPAQGSPVVQAWLDPTDPMAPDRVYTALAPLEWRVYANHWGAYASYATTDQQSFLTIRRGLLIGAVFILLLAGVSLLVLALEHIRERRRPLAVLAASGVPTGVLARSLLWQIIVPIALGVAIAVVTGIALAALVLRLADEPLSVDWGSVGLMTAAAAVLGLLVTVVTLPFLRGATKVGSLRTE